jgi:hypothetical protein
LLSTGEPGSFAHYTLAARDPKILDELIEKPYFSPDIKYGFRKLRDELTGGNVQPLREDAPDRDFWRKANRPHAGRPWLDVPWYWAETFFYRRILEITGYFQMGAWRERDPFAPQKDAELFPARAPARVAQVLNQVSRNQGTPRESDSDGNATPLNERPPEAHVVFETLAHAAMWGNRVDLSYHVELDVGRAASVSDERENLLVDDAARVWEFLDERKIGELAYIADNAGSEFGMDLALVDFLLSGAARIERIVLHLKPQPFYVSDAMPQDFEKTLAAFDRSNETTRALAGRLRGYLREKRLVVFTHWFYATHLHYFELPDDLFDLLGRAGLVVLKGDVNYRRTVGDAHWPPTTPFEHATRYFPAPFICLRTLKAELILGLEPGRAEALDAIDPQWRVNGRRGVAQANLSIGSGI